MESRPLHLITARPSPRQRAHFSIFVPWAGNPDVGTEIHVVGAPMAGYKLEFKRNYRPGRDRDVEAKMVIGNVDAEHMIDSGDDGMEFIDDVPRDGLERVACQIPPPRISENFLQPVNDTTNRRCQEWTMDYVGRLVALGYLTEEAIAIVQAHRDPPSHGIGLQPLKERTSQAAGEIAGS